MKKQTKFPTGSASGFPRPRMMEKFSPEPSLYLLPRSDRKRVSFLISNADGEKSLYTGSISPDDVEIVIYAGRDPEWGYACHIITRSRETFLVKGDLNEVERAIFGETSK
jgi:hypothetical protein